MKNDKSGKSVLRRIRKYIPTWLGGARLSDNDQAQAHIMGMALASLKAAEANALLILNMSQQFQELKNALQKLQAPSGVLATYTLAANQAKAGLEEYPEGSIEHEAFLLMSSELFGIAKTLQDIIESKNKDKEEKHGAGDR